MSTMNPQQLDAYNAFTQFNANPESSLFCLFGAAGTGKSFTSGRFLDVINENRGPLDEILWLAPTWKAVRVAGRFLSDNGLTNYEVGYDYYFHRPGRLILTTTQQALGIRPMIGEEEQDDRKVKFGKLDRGVIQKLRPAFVVIDEVSMLSWQHLKDIVAAVKSFGGKVLIIGDPNQLPPVNAQEIKWDRLSNRYELTQIMRQSGDSAIPHFGRTVIEGGAWHDMTGPGLRKVTKAVDAFLGEVGVPSANEEERDVFVGYRNRTVDAVQEAACQKVYGHDAETFEAGEVVIAQSAFHVHRQGMVVANQDQLEILEVTGKGVWGETALVRNLAGRKVLVEYLSGRDQNDRNNPWNVRLEQLRGQAMDLQKAYKSDRSVDKARRAAWTAFFEHKDQTVLDFAHPFAITSHKSQGSSYRRAFIAADEIADFSPKRGLYVAATRPKEELVL